MRVLLASEMYPAMSNSSKIKYVYRKYDEYFVEIEDEIQFADIAEVAIQDFNKGLHEFEDDELVLILVDNCYEIQARVSLIDNFVLFVIYEIAHLGISGDD